MAGSKAPRRVLTRNIFPHPGHPATTRRPPLATIRRELGHLDPSPTAPASDPSGSDSTSKHRRQHQSAHLVRPVWARS